jgi:hypothetical protein
VRLTARRLPQPAAMASAGWSAPAARGVGLVVARCQPGPAGAGQLRGFDEAVHITDLGKEHRTQDRPFRKYYNPELAGESVLYARFHGCAVSSDARPPVTARGTFQFQRG